MNNLQQLQPRRLGIDTYQEPVIYLRNTNPVCHSEGFSAQSRVFVRYGDRHVIATLNVVHAEWLAIDEIGFSESAWRVLQPEDHAALELSHAPPVDSMAAIRGKMYGQRLTEAALHAVIRDMVAGHLTDVEIASFVTVTAGNNLDQAEIIGLTRAMIAAGDRLDWGAAQVVDKHCVGGLPGNRTTPVVVAILAASGLRIPKTSSRAITSPAGTADTMETLTRVALSLDDMRRVVEQEGGCLVWGGAVHLSPADDLLIRIERVLDVDSSSQMVASVLSKKAAAGATDVLIDIPVGPTAKVRSDADALDLARLLETTGSAVGLRVRCMFSDGSQPVGFGIGPALEAKDVLAVLQCAAHAPESLRHRALDVAGNIFEMVGKAQPGCGMNLAASVLDSGAAWQKFQAICHAQGGLREPPEAPLKHAVVSSQTGVIIRVDNRRLAKLAKLAGAPASPAAGIRLCCTTGQQITTGQPLFELHAESRGELDYALGYLAQNPDIYHIE